MRLLRLILLAGSGVSLFAQGTCNNTPAYTPCEFVFELNAQEAAAHANPYTSVELAGEFRSPHFHTFKLPAYWDGGQRLILRFTPTEAGEWLWKLSSNIARWDGQTGSFTAAASDLPGFIRAANVHHWAYTEGNNPHLWMGDTLYPLATLDPAIFQHIVDARAAQKFNHIRGYVLPEQASRAYASPDQPNPEYFQRLDQAVRYMNQKGIVADLILAGPDNQLTSVFPDWKQRQRYIAYVIARYAPLNVTWEGVEAFETYDNGRATMKEIGTLLKDNDPFQHPRSSGNLATSGPMMEDGWMSFVAHHTGEDAVCAVEHQLFGTPMVNLKFAGEDSGAGKSAAEDGDAEQFRHALWNTVMDGDYPTFFNTGTAGAGKITPDGRYTDSPGARAMTVWYNLFAGARHWELEPYFDVDGGRAVALEEAEYFVYVEHPGPVELLVESHSYEVTWINPADGQEFREKKNYHGQHFTGEPPDRSHDWVLHLSREGHKAGMLKSYKFESRRIAMQVVEQNVQKVPFAMEQPVETDLSQAKPPAYAVKFTHETRATRTMMWLWTGENSVDGEGYRVLGTGEKGTLKFPPHIAVKYPAVIDLRLYGMNANGKVYSLDKTFTLNQ